MSERRRAGRSRSPRELDTDWYVHGHWFRRQLVHFEPGVGAPSQRVLRRRQKSQARSDFLAYAAPAATAGAVGVTALDGPGEGSGLNSSIWIAKGAPAMFMHTGRGPRKMRSRYGERCGRLLYGFIAKRLGGGGGERTTGPTTLYCRASACQHKTKYTRLLRTI